MNIIANENLYDPMVEVLRNAGHLVFDTKHTELAGALMMLSTTKQCERTSSS